MATRTQKNEDLSELSKTADEGTDDGTAADRLVDLAEAAGLEPDDFPTWAELATALAGDKPVRTRRTRTRANGNGNGTTRTRRTRRSPREVVPMTPAVKAAAMQALTTFEASLGEESGFEGASTRNGKNGSLSKTIRIDGHRATVRVLYR